MKPVKNSQNLIKREPVPVDETPKPTLKRKMEVDDEKDLKPLEEIVAQVEIKNEPEEAENPPQQNAYEDDMDFSILEDDENQFEEAEAQTVKKEKEEAVKKSATETYENLLTNWENICNEEDDELLGSVVEEDLQNITKTIGKELEMKFWFWDAWEDPVKFPGKVFLFGRVPSKQDPKEFNSVCIAIENVERCLYLLPREYVSVLEGISMGRPF